MEIDLYERIWMWAATAIIVAFLGAIVLTTGEEAIQPPSHVETIDPATIPTHPEFGAPKVSQRPDGSVVVPVVAAMFAFSPSPIEVPAQVPVTFRVTSSDVIHGFEIAGTNANAMVIPGYVSQFTITFPKAGEYQIVCNEYCGLVHHMMSGKLIVK
jgi:cytochrome c oxidase subunit 2